MGAPLLSGTKLGRYEIRSKLGAGGMGEVYLAQDTKLDRKVALKVLPAEVASDRGRMSRFVQEAKAASALNHPNILTIHEIDQADSVHFIATEFIDGETLRQRMKNAPMKLGDVLYEMVAGCLPFAGSTSSEVVASILGEKEPQPLARYSREVPAELERIVSKALRKNRDERYQTIKDLLLDLKSLKQELDLERKLERSRPPQSKSTTNVAAKTKIETAIESAVHATVSTKGATTTLKFNQRGVVIAVAALLIVALGAGAYFYFTRASRETINSIAVLPFVNESGNADAEYLSDGISESLINSLSQLPRVKVIARSSSFKYKGKEFDPQEVARKLGVEAILTGRVLQRGDNLLISVELMNARDKTQMWGEQYNREATNLLAVQSEISREIAERLRLKLTNVEQQQLAKRETANPQAYELVLKGNFYRNKGGTENRKKSIEYFQQAIAIDANYALAYAELSAGYSFVRGDPKEMMPKREAAARKALELDENLAEGHFEIAQINRGLWKWQEAEREHRRTIELNPNLARAHAGYSGLLSLLGRHDESVGEVKRARELDPFGLIVNTVVGRRLLHARRYDEAIETLKKTIELDQNFPDAHRELGNAYATKGMYREAIAEYQMANKLGMESYERQIRLGAAYAKLGDRERALAILKQLQTDNSYVSPALLAILHTALDEREQAFTSLEKAYAERDPQLQWLGVEPGYDSLRSDQRFAELMRRVGLPQ